MHGQLLAIHAVSIYSPSFCYVLGPAPTIRHEAWAKGPTSLPRGADKMETSLSRFRHLLSGKSSFPRPSGKG